MISILFDMDGVLVDSEPVITEASMLALRELGIPARHEDFKPFTGMGEDSFVGGVAERYGRTYHPDMKHRAYEIYLERVEQDLVVYPGLLEALRRLSTGGRRMAVASAADRVKVEANLRVARIPAGILSAIITGSDVERKKPAPDIYLAAARAIGESPENCLVVEDAVAGVQAAVAAGMRCVAVTTSFTKETLIEAGASEVIATIADLPAAVERMEAGGMCDV